MSILSEHQFWIEWRITLDKQFSKSELKREMINAMREMNIRIAEHRAPVHSQQEILGFKGITELRRLGKFLRVKYYGKQPKPALIQGIVEAMNQPAMLRLFLDELNKSEWEFFLRAAAQKKVKTGHLFFDQYISIHKLGLLQSFYHDDQLFFVVPDEIKATFKQLISSGYIEKKNFHDDLIEFAVAAINLYGVISQEDFVALYNSHYERQTNIDEMFSVLVQQVYAEIGFCFWEEYIVDDEFEEDDFRGVKRLLADRKNKPRYSPPFEEFIQYADWNYYEFTPQMAALQRHLAKFISKPLEMLKLLDEIHDYCQAEARPQIYFDLLESAGICFAGIDQVNEMFQLIIDVQNNTRLWYNHGHTPNELSRYGNPKIIPFPAGRSVSAMKAGRNDPCPCGSGKKFKNCCGK